MRKRTQTHSIISSFIFFAELRVPPYAEIDPLEVPSTVEFQLRGLIDQLYRDAIRRSEERALSEQARKKEEDSYSQGISVGL